MLSIIRPTLPADLNMKTLIMKFKAQVGSCFVRIDRGNLFLLQGGVHATTVTMLSTDGLIGGQGRIVEINEMKFGHRKCKRGHVIVDRQIFGALYMKSKQFHLEMCSNNRQDHDTLIPIIKKHILLQRFFPIAEERLLKERIIINQREINPSFTLLTL